MIINILKIQQIIAELFEQDTLTDAIDIAQHVTEAARITAKLIIRIAGLDSDDNGPRGLHDEVAVEWCLNRYKQD